MHSSWYRTCASYFAIRGRANRSEFWKVAGILFVVSLLTDVSFRLLPPSATNTAAFAELVNIVAIVISVILIGALNLATWATWIRRLHDRNRSGWWLLVFAVVPGLALEMPMAVDANAGWFLEYAFVSVAYGLAGWGLVELGFLPGTQGPNDFGPDPIAARETKPAVEHASSQLG